MKYELLLKIKSNPNYVRYLRENSHWYKILNRDEERFNDMILEMKTKYKMRTSDKIDKISTGLDLINLFLDSDK